jgi:hypothetical protein
MQRGDRGLYLVRAGAHLKHRFIDESEPFRNCRPVPQTAVLIL